MRRYIWVLFLCVSTNSAYSQKSPLDEPGAAADAIVATLRGNQHLIECIAYGPNGEFVACGDSGDILLFDLASPEAPRRLMGHRDFVWSLVFTPDAEMLISLGADGTIRLWNREDDLFSERLVVSIDEGNFLFAELAISPDGKALVAAPFGMGKRLRLWSIEDNHLIERAPPEPEAKIEYFCAAFSAENGLLGAMGPNGSDWLRGTATVWKWPTWDEVAEIEYRDIPFVLTFSPHEKTVVLSDGGLWRASRLRLLDLETSPPGQRLEFVGHDERAITFAQFSPDGERLISAGTDGKVIVWNTQSGDALHVIEFPFSHSESALSPDGRYLATCYRKGPVYIVRLPE